MTLAATKQADLFTERKPALPPVRKALRSRVAKLLATSAFIELSASEKVEIEAALLSGESRR